MSETRGVLAALAAPFFMACGFLIWDVTWKKAGGSAFALNMFKCNLASICFAILMFIYGFSIDSMDTNNSEKINNDVDDINTTSEEELINVVTSGADVGYLILSGFIGIVIGDSLWLEALRTLGATRTLVVDTMKPFAAATLGWIILDERLNIIGFSGIVLTVIGILVVSLEKEGSNIKKNDGNDHTNDDDDESDQEELVASINEVHCDSSERDDGDSDTNDKVHDEIIVQQVPLHPNDHDIEIQLPRSPTSPNESDERIPLLHRCCSPDLSRGYILAVLNVALDTYGSVLTKQHGGNMTVWAINLLRFGSAGVTLLLVSIIMRCYHYFSPPSQEEHIEDRQEPNPSDGVQQVESQSLSTRWHELPTSQINVMGWIKLSLGVLFVTIICPSLSNYALFQIALALAITLGSVTPLYALLLEWPLKRKVPTVRAWIGACFASGGVVVLAIWR